MIFEKATEQVVGFHSCPIANTKNSNKTAVSSLCMAGWRNMSPLISIHYPKSSSAFSLKKWLKMQQKLLILVNCLLIIISSLEGKIFLSVIGTIFYLKRQSKQQAVQCDGVHSFFWRYSILEETMKFLSDARIKAKSHGFGHSLGKKQMLISSPCSGQYIM